MPDIPISIGGREYIVACEAGEEPFLQAAVKMLDGEASALMATGARLTSDRMLLMAGLMLADKALSTEEQLKAMEERLAQQAARIDALQDAPPPEPVRVEVMPEGALDRLRGLADQAEALASAAEAKG